MGSHRRKWGWWLVAALAVAVAASLFLRRRTAGQPEASFPAAEAESPGTVVRDTVYVTVDGGSVPVIRERKVNAGEPEVDAPMAATETVVTVPVKDINGLIHSKGGKDVSLSTQAPDRITLTYAGKVNVPVLGEQGMDFSASFKVVEVKGDRLVLQLDSGAAMNLAAGAVAPFILERLPEGFIDSFSSGRAVVNLSAIPQLKKQLKSLEIVGFSLDEDSIRLRTVEK